MSIDLESRLRQGFHGTIDELDIDTVDSSAAFVKVMETVQKKQRTQLVFALAAATAAVVAIVTAPRIADIALSFERPNPAPADEQEESREEIKRNTEELLEDLERVRAPKNVDRDEGGARERHVVGGVTTAGSGTGGSADDRGSGSGVALGSDSSGGDGSAKQPEERKTPKPAEPAGHTETKDYSASALPAAGGTTTCDQGSEGGGCVRFQSQEGERFVEISIEDVSGSDVSAAVQIDRDGNGDIDGEWTFICNETARRISIPGTGKAIVWVEIEDGSCEDGTESNPVRGSVTAVFSS